MTQPAKASRLVWLLRFLGPPYRTLDRLRFRNFGQVRSTHESLELGIEFLPLERTLKAQCEALVRSGLLKLPEVELEATPIAQAA